jgi:hypothetical protein
MALFRLIFAGKTKAPRGAGEPADGTKLADITCLYSAVSRRFPMTRFAYALSIVAVVALSCFPALAQDTPSSKVTGVIQNGNKTIVFENNSEGLNLDQIGAFAQVKTSDPALADKLAKNPKLVNDEGFVNQHPALQQYLAKYPSAREDIAINPGNYLTPVNGSSWSHAAPGLKN